MATNFQEKHQSTPVQPLMGRIGNAQSYSEVQRPQKTFETLLRVWFYLRRQHAGAGDHLFRLSAQGGGGRSGAQGHAPRDGAPRGGNRAPWGG